jgi:hypothetical protein
VSGKLLLVIITVCVLGGAIGGAVVIWVKDEDGPIEGQNSTVIVESAPQQTERPRAKSHYIKPGIERKI